MKNLPLGIQTFKDIIETDYLYVDKTEDIYELLKHKGKYFFLSRPRRFGKSLLISTLEQIFLGNKDLFKGLYIYDKIEWKKYPVIRIDFSNMDLTTPETLIASISNKIFKIARDNNIKLKKDNTYKQNFSILIEKLAKTEKVVILIDEYDKPIINFIDKVDIAVENREILKNFYETIKACDEYIHFTFLTGVSKFAKVSVFSGLNNLTDITLNDKFSKIVGLTEEQVHSYFEERIRNLAVKLKITEDVLKKELKRMYNGYSWDGINFLYNPYSLLLLFDAEKIDNYWFQTGTPTFLIKMIKEYDLDIKKLEKCILDKSNFDSYDVDKMNVIALLFQTGYLTIKEVIEYDIYDREYVLSYPNMEVKDSLLKSILSDMLDHKESSEISVARMIRCLKSKDIEGFFKLLISLLATIPNQIHPEKESTITNKEFYYHTIFHIIFTLIGVKTKSEVSVSSGRIDSIVETDNCIFIFEFKLEKNSEKAIEQIEDLKYYQGYLASKKEIFLIGVSFDMKKRNIKNYISKKLESNYQ